MARRTDKRVVLHIDDIEKLAGNDNTYSTFLNLFAGVRESDFYVIASTNEPETIPKALIQPQRLSTLIYCGLQSERVRYEILKIHAIEASIGLKTPLFKSAGEREDILTTLAAHTEYFTPRYLEDIINVAKSHFLERVAIEENKTTGLTEDDLKGRTFCLKDFELAYAYVASICNCQGLKTRDEELRRLVKRSGNGHLGFAPNGSDTVDIFSALRHHN